MLYRRIVIHQDQQFGLILSSHIFVFDVSIDWNKKGCWSIQLQFKAFEKETARMTALPDMEIMNLGMINLNDFLSWRYDMPFIIAWFATPYNLSCEAIIKDEIILSTFQCCWCVLLQLFNAVDFAVNRLCDFVFSEDRTAADTTFSTKVMPIII